MRRSALSAIVLLAVPLVAVGSGVSAAPTSTLLGEVVATPNVLCSGGGMVIQGATAPGGASYEMPSQGVITAFSTRANVLTDQRVQLGLLGPLSGNIFPVMAKSATFAMLSASVNTFAVRIPVQKGWLLGARFTASGNMPCAQTTGAAGDDMYSVAGGSFDNPAVVGVNAGDRHVNLSAVFEPDADADGYGDVSQDACPESALAVAACPAPETTVTKAPKAKSKNRTVTVAFASSAPRSTFLVSVDGKPAVELLSPLRQKLKPGKHTITIAAVSPLGIVDLSPASVSFQIKKAKHRR